MVDIIALYRDLNTNITNINQYLINKCITCNFCETCNFCSLYIELHTILSWVNELIIKSKQLCDYQQQLIMFQFLKAQQTKMFIYHRESSHIISQDTTVIFDKIIKHLMFICSSIIKKSIKVNDLIMLQIFNTLLSKLIVCIV